MQEYGGVVGGGRGVVGGGRGGSGWGKEGLVLKQ